MNRKLGIPESSEPTRYSFKYVLVRTRLSYVSINSCLDVSPIRVLLERKCPSALKPSCVSFSITADSILALQLHRAEIPYCPFSTIGLETNTREVIE